MKKIVADWKANARNDLNENKTFLKSIPKNKNTDSLASDLHEEVFKVVDCLQCANCCKTTPALVTRPDAKRIAKHLSIPPKTFIKKYLIEDINGELMIARVPCTFLNGDNTCQIYDVRPQACREYPHTNQFGFSRRAKMNANNTIVCPAVYEIVNRLKKVSL